MEKEKKGGNRFFPPGGTLSHYATESKADACEKHV